jgi:hypothetical protein
MRARDNPLIQGGGYGFKLVVRCEGKIHRLRIISAQTLRVCRRENRFALFRIMR